MPTPVPPRDSSRGCPLHDAERIERAVPSLSPMERDVLALSAGHGLRNREIGARLGISERHAERLLARALRTVARAMEEPRVRPRWRRWLG